MGSSRLGRAVRVVGRAVTKAAASAAATVFRFIGRTTYGMLRISGRSRLDYAAAVGDGSQNAIIMACVLWICRTFPEAPLRVAARQSDGTWQAAPDHPLINLLERPNPFYSGPLLWNATLSDLVMTGNAYWFKVRSAGGRVVQVWWIPKSLVEPKWPADGSAYLSHYEYSPDGRPIRVEVADLVHFRYGLDPENTRLGRSPVASLLREVFSDDEAATYTASLLRNMGIPGVILAPDDADVVLSGEDAEAVKAQYMQRFGGDHRGEPLVMTGKTQVTVLGFDPKNMDLAALRRIPEERISAVLGIPAIVAGLGAGLQRATFANYAEAREAAYESNIIPTQRLLAAELNSQLVGDFGDPARDRVEFDLSQVRVLQADQNALSQRLTIQYQADVAKRSEVRRALGYAFGPEDEFYKSELDALLAPPPAPAMLGAPSVTTLAHAASTARRSLPVLALKAGRGVDWPARAARDRAGLTERGAGLLGPVFARAGRQVLDTLSQSGKAARAVKAAPELPADFDERLAAAFAELHGVSIDQARATVADGLAADFELPFTVRQGIIDQLAADVTGVADETRRQIAAAVADGVEAGETLDQLRTRVADLFDTMSSSRAMTIARTESGNAYNLGTVASYRESGVVKAVGVLDGEDDEPCRSANGATWSFDEAAASPLGHPNCSRSFFPIVE